MRVLIIEDERQTAQRLQDLIYRYDNQIEVLGIIPSVEKTLAYFSQPAAVIPDLIFLDIHLEDDLGFRIPEELNITLPIIFTTAFEEYALKAFKTFSIDYLLKPIDYQELIEAMEKFKKVARLNPSGDSNKQLTDRIQRPEYKDRFMVSAGLKLQSIPTSQIAYFSYQQRSTFINTVNGHHFDIDYSLEKILDLVDPKQFFRLNRSYIVSMSSIQSIDLYSAGKLKVVLQPQAGQEIFVSIDRVTAFKEWLGK